MCRRIKLIKGDITKVSTEVIVNAANTSLIGTSGVSSDIHKAGGIVIDQQCMDIRRRLGGCKTGEIVVTDAGNLDARYVIHTVGPVWKGGEKRESELLYNCYTNALKESVRLECKKIAFPNISTGIYGYPKKEAAKIALRATEDFLKENKEIEEVLFVSYDEENYEIYDELLKQQNK